MILLFGDKATKTAATRKNSNINNHPVENSGILAMSLSDAKSLLTMGEYDTYVSSNPVAVDYSAYSDFTDGSVESGFMASFSEATAFLGGDSGMGGYSSAASFSGSSAGTSCGGSFASVC